MDMTSLFMRLQETSLAVTIRESGFLFPSIECVHVLALTLVVSSIAVVSPPWTTARSQAARWR